MPANIWIDVQRQRSMNTSSHSNNIDCILEKGVRHSLITLEAWNESFENLEMGLQAWALFSAQGERQYKWPGAMAFGSWSWIMISIMPLPFFLPITHTYKRRLTDRSEHEPPKPVLCLNLAPHAPITAEDNLYPGDTYLVSLFSEDNSCSGDISITFSNPQTSWNSNQYSLKINIRLHQSNVKSVLLYGSEWWQSPESHMRKINTVHNGCLQ